MKRHSIHIWLISLIIVTSAVLRLLFTFESHVLYWDGAVYIGMAKFLYSWGGAGLLEPLRPVIWPLILGLPWVSGLNTIISGYLIQLIFSLGIIYLTYLIGTHIWDSKTGVISAAIMAFSSSFFILNYRLLSEIPATFFAMLSIYLYLKKKPVWSGVLTGIAFMTKFPFGIFLVVIILADLKKPKNLLRYIGGFAIPTMIFLLWNAWWYSNPFIPFIQARDAISQNLACNYFFANPWYYYFTQIPLDNLFFIPALIGIYFVFRRFDMPNRLLLFGLLLPLSYITQLSCKDIRFALMLLPILAVLAGVGLSRSLRFSFNRWPEVYPMLVLIILCIAATVSLTYYHKEEPTSWPQEKVDFYEYLASTHPDREVVSASPWPAVYADIRIRPLYYYHFNTDSAGRYAKHFLKNKEYISFVIIDECAGGVECHPDDNECLLARSAMFYTLNTGYDIAYSYQEGDCNFVYYTPKDI